MIPDNANNLLFMNVDVRPNYVLIIYLSKQSFFVIVSLLIFSTCNTKDMENYMVLNAFLKHFGAYCLALLHFLFMSNKSCVQMKCKITFNIIWNSNHSNQNNIMMGFNGSTHFLFIDVRIILRVTK